MIEINLLPSGASRRAPAARRPRGGSVPRMGGGDPRIAALGGAAVLFVILAAFGFWKTGAAAAEVQSRVDRAVADSAQLARTIAMLDTLEGQRTTIERKIGVIRSVDGRRYVWPHLMDEIARSTPQFTWLTKVAVSEEADASAAAPADTAAGDSAAPAAAPPPGPSFSLEGHAGGTQALTRFMKTLEGSPMIRDVALITSEQVQTDGRPYLRFTLEGRYEQPDTALIQTVPVVTLQ